TSFDTEIVAIAAALDYGVTCGVNIIRIFTDNSGAITRALDPSIHPSQMVSIRACVTARRFLKEDPARRIEFWWCPAHKNIWPNEVADQHAKAACGEHD
ncbi:hypothetical protein BDN72DRAFT_751731, partial [Pluteus cervinus]